MMTMLDYCTWDRLQQKELTSFSTFYKGNVGWRCRVHSSESRERASSERHRSSHKMQRRSRSRSFLIAWPLLLKSIRWTCR